MATLQSAMVDVKEQLQEEKAAEAQNFYKVWLAKVEDQLRFLKEVQSIKRVDAIEQIRALRKILEKGYKWKIYRFRGGTKQLHNARNELRSIIDALERREFEGLSLYPLEVKELVRKVKENQAEQIKQQLFKEQGLSSKEQSLLKADIEVENRLYEFRSSVGSILQSLEHNPFAFGNAPIIPMLIKGSLRKETLDAHGVANADLAGYQVLSDQTVIAVNAKRTNLGAYEYAQQVLEQINLATGQKLKFVTRKSHNYNGYSWFWVSSSKTIEALIAACNYEFDVKIWSLSV